MNFRSQEREDIDLNITPLIDVVFLLLIFFMVSTTFERQSEISLTLPEATEEVSEDKDDQIEIAIDPRGNIYLNEQQLVNSKMETIRESLRDLMYDMNSPTLIISADAATEHQMVVRVMDAARQLDLVNITFATQEIKEQ